MKIAVYLLAFLLFACSSTTVHLNTKYLSKQQVAEIVETLQQQDFRVETNQHRYPDEINQSSLIYSLMISDNSAVNKLHNVLNELGWTDLKTNPLKTNNHWYTKDTIGLFLVPENIEPNKGQTAQDLLGRYIAVGCERQWQLVLKNNGVFDIQTAGQPIEREYGSGFWEMRQYPYLELRARGDSFWAQFFEIKQRHEIDQISAITFTDLVPVNNAFKLTPCQFTQGIRG